MDKIETEIEREFSGFIVNLRQGSRNRQTLSNRLELRVPGDRTEVSVRLTPRQARALQKFLNENL